MPIPKNETSLLNFEQVRCDKLVWEREFCNYLNIQKLLEELMRLSFFYTI